MASSQVFLNLMNTISLLFHLLEKCHSHSCPGVYFTSQTDKVTGHYMCAMDQASATSMSRSSQECSHSCLAMSTSQNYCLAFNNWSNNETCEFYFHVPTNYSVQAQCVSELIY